MNKPAKIICILSEDNAHCGCPQCHPPTTVQIGRAPSRPSVKIRWVDPSDRSVKHDDPNQPPYNGAVRWVDIYDPDLPSQPG